MTTRGRVVAFVGVVALVGGSATAYAVVEAERYHDRYDAAPAVESRPASSLETQARIVFRHTGTDDRFGRVAMVALDDPGGPRAFTPAACDRVDATAAVVSCLRTQRGVVTRHLHEDLGADWAALDSHGLTGVPSRTRLSPDGSLVASTVFVSGHSYMETGFSTATVVRRVGGPSLGNLEDFALVRDGERVAPTDRNVWGVSFVDDRTFYATVATGGETHLVAGDVEQRTLTTVRTNAECPSVSPDGSEVVYKVDGPGRGTHWSWAVLDLSTGEQRVLAGESAHVDDQAAWLDDDTVLYGLPRTDEPGVTDVWALDTTPGAQPRLLIEQAWSPSVVRP